MDQGLKDETQQQALLDPPRPAVPLLLPAKGDRAWGCSAALSETGLAFTDVATDGGFSELKSFTFSEVKSALSLAKSRSAFLSGALASVPPGLQIQVPGHTLDDGRSDFVVPPSRHGPCSLQVYTLLCSCLPRPPAQQGSGYCCACLGRSKMANKLIQMLQLCR